MALLSRGCVEDQQLFNARAYLERAFVMNSQLSFEKPNDERAFKPYEFMCSCYVVLEEFGDIVFAYGVSDSFEVVCSLRCIDAQIVSVVVSFFTSAYVTKWKRFFPLKELKYQPSFDGRARCYPSSQILQDYFALRQVDCHINNQYNTCFWMVVKEGKSKSQAQRILKGTQTREKNELLMHKFKAKVQCQASLE